MAPGDGATDYGQTIDLDGVTARYVKLAIHGNFPGGDNGFVGLSEVQIFGVPEPSSMVLAALAAVGMAVVVRRRRAAP
jgi:hypothetical protein